jgi:hypothetical protein
MRSSLGTVYCPVFLNKVLVQCVPQKMADLLVFFYTVSTNYLLLVRSQAAATACAVRANCLPYVLWACNDKAEVCLPQTSSTIDEHPRRRHQLSPGQETKAHKQGAPSWMSHGLALLANTMLVAASGGRGHSYFRQSGSPSQRSRGRGPGEELCSAVSNKGNFLGTHPCLLASSISCRTPTATVLNDDLHSFARQHGKLMTCTVL